MNVDEFTKRLASKHYPNVSAEELNDIIVQMIHHPRENLLPLLKDITEVIYTPTSYCFINWDMKTATSCLTDTNTEYYITKLKTFQHTDSVIEFVKRNKHQIAIHSFFISEWYDIKGVCVDPRPMMRYATKKGAIAI